MDAPEWVIQHVLYRASPVEGRLLLALFLHGKPVVGADGSRRLYWRASNERLSRAAASSMRGVMEARKTLAEDGVITVHESQRHKTPGAISAPVSAPARVAIDDTEEESWVATVATQQIRRVATIATQAESEVAHIDDDPYTPSSSEERSGSSTPSLILGELAELGVLNPAAMVKRYGEQHCLQALEQFRAIDASHVRNPAGLLHHLASTPSLPYRAVNTSEDPLEAAKRRFLGGRLGHLVRYR